MAVRYDRRVWEGDPGSSEGITHAVHVDRSPDWNLVAACGRVCVTYADFDAPPTQAITCVACVASMFKRQMW